MRLLVRYFHQIVICSLLLAANPWSVSADEFQDDVVPVLKRRCFRCHNADEQSGQVRLDTLRSDLIQHPADAETWHDALNAINLGKMPPADEPQLTRGERTTLVDWLTKQIQLAIRHRRGAGGQAVLRRLNRVEYQNTMRDLIGLDIDYARNLPPDEFSVDGFQNNGAALGMSALQLEYFLQAARDALQRTIVEGPPPPVFTHQAVETVADKGKDNWNNRLGRSGIFVARVPDFPDEGEFELRIRARAEIPADAAYPQMEIRLGYRADTQTPSRLVGRVDVSDPEAREFTFRGRIEEFPLQSRTQSKYPGLLIWIRNAYSDGQPAPPPRKVSVEVNGKKSKKKQLVWEEDPGFPKVVIESIDFKAPVYTQWPPAYHRRILAERPQDRAGERVVVEQTLRRFMTRAYRRPVSDAAVNVWLDYFERIRPNCQHFEEALRESLAMVLISPEFLYRIEHAGGAQRERAQTGDERQPLDDYALASRLSYFLWSSMPDDELFELAQQQRLREPEVLRAQVERMLGDARVHNFVEQFSDQWLDLPGVDRVAVNPNYYPDFDTDLKVDLRRESQQFFATVLTENLSLLNFLQSDFVVINEPLARHYGIRGPRGSSFERVELPPGSPRGGLLAQGSILLANSNGEDSHPILRGVWLRRVLLDDPPAPPPPNVPDLAQEGVDASLLPLREQLNLHRENAACAHCHQRIDPWGIALEQFDAVGQIRDSILRRSGRRELRHPVDASTQLPDGTAIDGLAGLREYLVRERSEQFVRAVAVKMLTYALGRTLTLQDQAAVNELVDVLAENDNRIQSLIQGIVTSDVFLYD